MRLPETSEIILLAGPKPQRGLLLPPPETKNRPVWRRQLDRWAEIPPIPVNQ
jgi:hypothetical protein